MKASTGSLLLIDDERLNRRVLSRQLERKGFTVTLAENGRQGLSVLESRPFDLVLLDMMMPEMDGLEVLRMVRKSHSAIELPIIMVTANTASQDVVEALNMGANDYITKPVDFPVALARIESVLKRKRSYQHMLNGRNTLGEQNSDGTTTLHTGPLSRLQTPSEFREFLAGADGIRINIGAYEADGVIGHGAMGIVVKAYDPALCRYVALKMLAPDLAKCPKARQRFALEGRFAAALRHPNVVSVYGVSEMESIPYLVMEYVSGQSLQQLLDLSKKFTASEIARIGRETAFGLAAAHDLRLIHRDIKPANLLVENNTSSVRIADFGLARDLDHDANISQKGLLLGTPLFMSPEQVDGKPLTPASDLFSLGSVLYTLCTNQTPFSAESLSRILSAIAEKHPTPIHVLNPDIPVGLACAIENLLSKEPLQRCTAGALAERLGQWEREHSEIQLTI